MTKRLEKLKASLKYTKKYLLDTSLRVAYPKVDKAILRVARRLPSNLNRKVLSKYHDYVYAGMLASGKVNPLLTTPTGRATLVAHMIAKGLLPSHVNSWSGSTNVPFYVLSVELGLPSFPSEHWNTVLKYSMTPEAPINDYQAFEIFKQELQEDTAATLPAEAAAYLEAVKKGQTIGPNESANDKYVLDREVGGANHSKTVYNQIHQRHRKPIPYSAKREDRYPSIFVKEGTIPQTSRGTGFVPPENT